MPYQEVSGTRVPIRMWADPDGVDDQVMGQLRNISGVPWVHGLAVMPDVHRAFSVGAVRRERRIQWCCRKAEEGVGRVCR